MPDRDEYLRNVTYKGGKFSVAERVLNTLLNLNEQRPAKALAWLVTHLHEQGTLTLDDIDNLLYAMRPADD
jgi:hypothetical protein